MKNVSSQNGFTLVETLVAVTILLLVMIGPMSISATAARSTSFSSEQVTAFFLAQEGAEITQKARDDRVLANFFPADPTDGWLEFTDTTVGAAYADCYEADGCGLELNTDATGSLKNPVDCTDVGCGLNFDPNGDRARYTYNHLVGTITPYTRTIYMEIINANEVKVTSEVTWRTGSLRSLQKVEVVTYLFNVYGN